MKIKIKLYTYILTDARGNHDTSTVDNLSSSICFGGHDKNGQYQQYDSYEGCHSYAWAEKHGMSVKMVESYIDIEV